MLIRRLVCTALFALAAAGPATAPATLPTAGFAPPANWTKVERDKLTIFVAPDAKEGNSTAIVLWPAGQLDGDFAAAFAAFRQDARGAFDPLRAGDLNSFRSDRGYDCLSIQEVLQDSGGRKSLRNYVALRSGNRMQVCMFVADTLEGFSAHAKEADAFIATLRFATEATTRSAK